MKTAHEENKHLTISVEKISSFKGTDLTDLCDATESTLSDNSLSFNIGLGSIDTQIRDQLESYWKGTLLVPERQLIIGRLDGVIASSIQLVKPSRNNHTSSFAGLVDNHFVAPWARGYGLAKELLKLAEEEAKKSGLSILKLSARANLKTAIRLYEVSGYKCWGTLDKYEKINGEYIAGHFYYKEL